MNLQTTLTRCLVTNIYKCFYPCHLDYFFKKKIKDIYSFKLIEYIDTIQIQIR